MDSRRPEGSVNNRNQLLIAERRQIAGFSIAIMAGATEQLIIDHVRSAVESIVKCVDNGRIVGIEQPHATLLVLAHFVTGQAVGVGDRIIPIDMMGGADEISTAGAWTADDLPAWRALRKILGLRMAADAAGHETVAGDGSGVDAVWVTASAIQVREIEAVTVACPASVGSHRITRIAGARMANHTDVVPAAIIKGVRPGQGSESYRSGVVVRFGRI